ncbi:type IV secretion system protein [Erythrobacter sp. JK5]|uniref:type IV secretion system protein n=1 Tax=Erythrobacter sp. JK5 TaxID=2829500 RepID=UPI001BAA9D10|nr:type IV secretion system protein [Erythrobacter sp. JK5]QUL36885.1 type IV secretion system protein [Erythrobacter sp. JK5]
MACPQIITGEQFLTRTLAHVDCQAEIIGSYGYVALGQPGSLASTLVAGLLTLFIAFFGIRLLLGPPPGARDVVYDVLKIGIVLTLAFSWPAFRTVIYDVTLKGPAEIASVIQNTSPSGGTGNLVERLQQADSQIVALIETGTGRQTGRFLNESEPGNTFAGTALQDDSAFGTARLLFLSSVIGTLALLRIGAGLLLALAPVVAGLYFFNQSRGIFAGWLKGLVLTIAGSIGATIVLSVQLAIIEPWLVDALRVRAFGYATPSTPIELFAIMLAFAVVHFAMIWFLAKVVFHRGWLTLPDMPRWRPAEIVSQPLVAAPVDRAPAQIVRAEQVSNTIERSLRREETATSERVLRRSDTRTASSRETVVYGQGPERLGSSYRRPAPRISRAAQRRDDTP